MWASKIEKKPSGILKAVKKKNRESPKIMSGEMIGMLLKKKIASLRFFEKLAIEIAASVPMIVEIIVEITAIIMVYITAWVKFGRKNNSWYHLTEKPESSFNDFLELNEKMMTKTTGIYIKIMASVTNIFLNIKLLLSFIPLIPNSVCYLN